VPTNGSAIFYWDYFGMQLPDSNAAYFVCNVSNVTPINPANAGYPTNYLALLQVTVRWAEQLTSRHVVMKGKSSVVLIFSKLAAGKP
jgi:hypothetical protein